MSEIKKSAENEQYKFYEDAYRAYSAAEKHIEESYDAVLFTSSYSTQNVQTL